MTVSGPMPQWLFTIFAIWLVWGGAWLAAALWANRTTGTAGATAQAPYRIINLIGWIALFFDGVYRRHNSVSNWHYFTPPLWRLPDWAGWLMVALALAGFLLAIWARLTLGKLWSAAVTRKEGHHLVNTGPYAITRHPIYTALLTGAVALAFAKGTPISLAGALILMIGYHLKARVEEAFLSRELGAGDYAAYRRKVAMIVPFWPRPKP